MQLPRPQPPERHHGGLVDQLSHGLEMLAEWLPRVVWRYRRELRPMLAAIVLWSHLSLVIAGVEWLVGAYQPAYVAGALATAVAGPFVTLRIASGRSAVERTYIWGCGGAATLWGVAAWTFGSFNLPMGSIDLAMGIAATVPWVIYLHHRKRFVGAGRVKFAVMRGGRDDSPAVAVHREPAPTSPRRVKRTSQEKATLRSEGNTILEHFQAAIAKVGGDLKDARAVSIEHDEYGDGWTMRVEGPGVKAVSAALEALEVQLDRLYHTRVGALQAFKEPSRASQALLRYLPNDPLATGLPLELVDEPASIHDPISLGMWDDMTPVMLPIYQRHCLVGGATGGGKSGALNVELYRFGMCRDVVIWGIDLKSGIELGDWEPRLDRLATTRAEALQLLKDAKQVMFKRGDMVRAMPGRKSWPASPGRPQLIVVIDEHSQLEKEDPKGEDPKEIVDTLVCLGRACGVQVVVATQKPVVAVIGQILSAQCLVKCALHCETDGDGGVILGAGRISEGWRASRLPEKGYFLGRWPEQTLPKVGRFFYLADDKVEDAVARTLPHKPALDSDSAPEPISQQTDPVDTAPAYGALSMVELALRDAAPDATSITVLSQRTGLATATLSKYLGVLVESGHVEKVGARGGFRWVG